MSRHPLTTTLDVKEGRSNPVPEEIIEKYRQTGDPALREWIIKSYIYLVLGMAGRYARWSTRRVEIDIEDQFDELSSVGLTALTQAVVWSGPHLDSEGEMQASRLENNNIEPYIKSTVKSWVRTFIERDRTVFMPGRTFRAKAAKGLLDPLGRSISSQLLGVISIGTVQTVEDSDFDDEGHLIKLHRPFAVPIARRENPEPEFEEALQLAVLNEREKRIIDLRREGHQYETIAGILGLTVSRISQIMGPIEERFLQLYA